MAKSIPAPSSMSSQPTLWGSSSATSSPASEGGVTRCDSLDGVTIASAGPAVVPVSRSRAPAPKLAARIRAIFGLRGSSSLRSSALASSLESRLKARLITDGSTVFKMTWKVRTTPSGRLVYLLRASARSTNGQGSGSWPTPTACSPATANYNEAGDSCNLRKMRLLVWATPTARDMRSESASEEYNAKRFGHTRGKPLSAQATLATWQSPTSGDAKSRTYQYDQWDKTKPRLSNEGQVSGAPQIGFPAPTGHSGQLNPAHSRWLMGYPPAWDVCAVTAMPSSRK